MKLHRIRSTLVAPGVLADRAVRLRVFLTVVSVGAALACREAEPPPRLARAVRVATVGARPTGTPSRFAGALEPETRLELSFKLGGRVARLLEVNADEGRRAVQEGDVVRKGAVLATLDPQDLLMQARAAQASLANVEAQERSAEAALAQAELDARRARYLLEHQTIARAELDRAETALRTAQGNLAAARAQRRSRAEEAALAAGNVEDTRLVSPVDGVVARRGVNAGERVGPGQPVFTILRTAEMRTVFGVPDGRVNDLALGDRVPVEVDALPGRLIEGRITKISPVPDPGLRSYAVEVTIPNSAGALKPGMVATARIAPDDAREAILVPLSAVARAPDGKGFAAFVLREGGRHVAARRVEIGDLHQDDVAIVSGLSGGERIVVDGAQFLHDGQQVEVVP
ncbi:MULTISPECIES: efflux RND transporter periplasmic adaptor subunit [Anaeromyxobacter]|uniref:efflux RND transporter periplasmic adaptor subunit n=1 Tax=Anaeromyxobacter TaxID=161492 RepID=UPI001F587DFB|nr:MULTISPECIES: efflux RND transporter periplasmic adaptor subunit [unclassified Anaeromyxobacter]